MFYVGLILIIAVMYVGVLHSANYSATLTELCRHFCEDVHFCTPSANFSQLTEVSTCMLSLHSDLI
jgi:hypothetical protein